jgi:pimeloyl-ACP methyl ester carboxylesterase/DNA-binding winged helix-turn-helix (wHTH) protein
MSQDRGVLAFGEYELDFERREVRCRGRPLDVQPTPLRLLLYLAEHRDRTVPKHELLDAIWPNVVVGDASLATALASVREALADDGLEQRVIRTHKGAGYRFVAHASSRSSELHTPRACLWRPALPVVVGAALLVVVGIGLAGRHAIGTWLALTLPRVGSRPIEQKINFATSRDGIRIAYATTGRGPPLVFVLGWLTHLTEGIGSPLYDASGFVSWYSRDHLFVRYDGRGFGLSDREVDDFGLEARVRDLEAVVDALGIERFALYACSAGGPTALAFAERHPDRVTRLVLAATFPEVGSLPRQDGEAFRRVRHGLRELARTSWDAPHARAAYAEFWLPKASEVERRVLMHFLRVSADGAAVAGFSEATEAIDVSEQARRIRVPTLVVAGSEDRAVPLALSRALAAAIPAARFEILDGADHVAASTADPRLMRLVSSFLFEGFPAPE